jgi:hypothetical protein
MPAMFSFSFGDFAPPRPRTWLGTNMNAAEVTAKLAMNFRRERCFEFFAAEKAALRLN